MEYPKQRLLAPKTRMANIRFKINDWQFPFMLERNMCRNEQWVLNEMSTNCNLFPFTFLQHDTT